MQQLLGGRPGMADGSFLRELFIQHHPPNVMAYTPDGTSLERLADLADKVIEVAAPSVAVVTMPTTLTNEVEHLREEVSRLEKQVQKLSRPHSSSRPAMHR